MLRSSEVQRKMTGETVKRRLAAILSADGVGYSRLMADDEVATNRTLQAHLARIGGAIDRHGGRVVDAVGDNLLAEFPSVVEAALCAVEIQHDLAERNAELAETKRLPFRIGLHLGDVIIEGERIRGDGVNVAARLEGLAPHGGVAISGAAFDLVVGKLGIEFDDLGEMTLKNIPRPTRVYVARLGTEVGGIRRQEIAPPRVPVAPRPRTRFIGRSDARREVAAALATDRLVTLTGVGGGGKSRLALQVADDVGRDFEAGVRCAELAAIVEDEQHAPVADAVYEVLLLCNAHVHAAAHQPYGACDGCENLTIGGKGALGLAEQPVTPLDRCTDLRTSRR